MHLSKAEYAKLERTLLETTNQITEAYFGQLDNLNTSKSPNKETKKMEPILCLAVGAVAITPLGWVAGGAIAAALYLLFGNNEKPKTE